jgi:general stress protein 26
MSVEVVEKAKNVVQEAGYGHLATAEGKQPRVRPIAMKWVGERELWFATHAGSRKIDQIAADAAVEVCFVSAQRDHARLSGRASTTQDDAERRMLFELIPELAQHFENAADPKYILVKIAIGRVEYMSHDVPEYATHEF